MNPKWRICPECKGEGTRDTLGAFTPSTLDEDYGDNWEERDAFVRDYRQGRYRERCYNCNGNGKVFKCPDCGCDTGTANTLEKARCYDCHINARPYRHDPGYAGEEYWEEQYR